MDTVPHPDVNPPRCLVAGGGSIGLRHARNLRALGASRLLIFEPNPTRRKLLAAEGFDTVPELEGGWAWQPQLLIIASPTLQHLPQALEGARRGSDLLIEKPLWHQLEGVEELRRECEQNRLVHMVACNMRWHPGPARVRELLRAGAIGAPLSARFHTGSYLPNWRPGTNYKLGYGAAREGGGAILDCIHELDLAQWMLGPARLMGAWWQPAAALGLETDGLAELVLQHEGGTLASVHLNFVQRNYQRGCTIIGDRGTLSWDFGAGQAQLWDEEGRLAQTFSQPAEWELNDMYLAQTKVVLECIATRQAAPNGVSEAATTLALATKARAPSNRVEQEAGGFA